MEATPDTLMQAQMYTPETLKSEGLALNCFRMVAWGLHMPELLDRYGERAVELVRELKPSEFSKILTAFARAEHRHDQMLRAFTRYIPARLPMFVPMDLSQTCNAYAKLRERDQALFRRLSAEMPHKLPLFETYQLKNVANAYARLSIRDDLLFDDIADEVMRRPQEFAAVDLLLIANAFSHFRVRHPRLWLTLADWLLQTYLDFEAVDVAVLLNAVAMVGFHNDVLIGTLVRHLSEEPLIGQLAPGDLCLAVNALARLRWTDYDHSSNGALNTLADRAAQSIGDLDPIGVARLLHACTRLRPLADHADLVEGVMERAHSLVPEFNAHSLSLVVHGCASLRRRDVPLLTKVAKAVHPCISDFTPQALALTANGFAGLDVRSEILFYLLAAEMVEKMPLFTGQGIGMALRAFGRLQICNERLLQACRKQVRALTDELTLAEIESIEAGLRALGALDSSTDSLLRRQRKQLGVEQAKGRTFSDAWTFDDDRLLQRLAEEAPEPSRGVATRQPTTSAAPSPPTSMDDATTLDIDSKQVDQGLDLWSLWAKDASTAEAHENPGVATADTVLASGVGDATSTTRLREYLARPERVGRRPVALTPSASKHNEQGITTPISSDVDKDGVPNTGGRKRSRRHR